MSDQLHPAGIAPALGAAKALPRAARVLFLTSDVLMALLVVLGAFGWWQTGRQQVFLVLLTCGVLYFASALVTRLVSRVSGSAGVLYRD